MNDLDQAAMWRINRAGWDSVAPHFYGAAALPYYGPYAKTESELGLLGNVQRKTILEIGCGSGHSLLYLAKQGAAELWGLDLSGQQIAYAQALLSENSVNAHLLTSPMEQNPGIPASYFDLAISIYSLGWTTDLQATLSLIYRYLKPGGFYVFSWEHPFYSCLEYEAGAYMVRERYRERSFVEPNWRGVPIVMHQRQVSTFINTALAVGFEVARMIEGEANITQANEADLAPERWYSIARAHLMPPTFILKLRKQVG